MVESEVTVNNDAVLAWLEKEAVEQGKALSDLDQGIFGGETIAEEIAGLVCRTDCEGLFVGPFDLPAISVSAYVCDLDAIILGLQPRESSVGESAFSYGQIASYTVDVDHLAIGESGTEKILSVLDAIAAEVGGLIPLYRAGIELSTHPGTQPDPPA